MKWKSKCHNCGKIYSKYEPGSTIATGNWAGDFYVHCSVICKESCKKDHD